MHPGSVLGCPARLGLACLPQAHVRKAVACRVARADSTTRRAKLSAVSAHWAHTLKKTRPMLARRAHQVASVQRPVRPADLCFSCASRGHILEETALPATHPALRALQERTTLCQGAPPSMHAVIVAQGASQQNLAKQSAPGVHRARTRTPRERRRARTAQTDTTARRARRRLCHARVAHMPTRRCSASPATLAAMSSALSALLGPRAQSGLLSRQIAHLARTTMSRGN